MMDLLFFLIDHVCRELSNSQCGNNVFFAACQMCVMYLYTKRAKYINLSPYFVHENIMLFQKNDNGVSYQTVVEGLVFHSS